ncbi:MAG: M56 family metallopeptidase [Candidatus Sifarchaeia archaeon]
MFRKYALLTFQHFIETCQQLAATFFTSGTHFIGLVLVGLTVLVAVIFSAKTLFSLIKTQKKIENLIVYKSNTIPNKLQKVLEKIGFKEDKVVVVRKKSDHAFNYGIKSQKIMLSEGLIRKLTSEQLEAVVLHEWYHLKNKHSLLLILSEIFSSTLFFLPLVKEIHRKMKVVFENQADSFTKGVQGGNSHLNMALLKVPDSRIKHYPGFALRRQHEVSRNSMYVSIFVILAAMSLYLFPISTHANELVSQQKGGECTQSQCNTTHCPTDNMSKDLVMSSGIQHTLSSVLY